MTFDVAAIADSGAYDTLTVAPVASGGSFSNSLLVRSEFTPKGDNGYTGTALLDFGAFPGASDAALAVTGQSAIAANSIVQCWIAPVATGDHSADEHLANPPRVRPATSWPAPASPSTASTTTASATPASTARGRSIGDGSSARWVTALRAD